MLRYGILFVGCHLSILTQNLWHFQRLVIVYELLTSDIHETFLASVLSVHWSITYNDESEEAILILFILTQNSWNLHRLMIVYQSFISGIYDVLDVLAISKSSLLVRWDIHNAKSEI